MGVTVREKVKGSGEWWVFLAHKGKRKSKPVGDKSSALAVAKEIRERIARGDMGLFKGEAPTFGEYADRWIEVTVPATCKSSTENDYQGLLKNHIRPVFGNQRIDQINKHQVKEFLRKKALDGLALSTVGHLKSALSGVLGLAVDDEVIPANPAQRLGKVTRQRDIKASIDPLSREELSLLLETIRQHYPAHYPLALTLARTGMRLGEALALQWGDLDFNGRFILVQRGFSGNGTIDTPKSGKTRRVDMSRQLAEVLQGLKHERKEEALRKGWGSVPEWVFVTSEGTPHDKNNWRNRVFDKALEKAKLRRVRVHDLRHTFASLLIQAGESLAYVRDQLGHHSIKITVDIYGHLAPGGNKQAVDRLDDAPFCTLSAPKRKKGLPENR